MMFVRKNRVLRIARGSRELISAATAVIMTDFGMRAGKATMTLLSSICVTPM